MDLFFYLHSHCFGTLASALLFGLVNESFAGLAQINPAAYLLISLSLAGGFGFYLSKKYLGAKKLRTQQEQEQDAELQLLTNQISPHFLFNSLNNIHSLCILEPLKASEMVLKLSDMLRYMLYTCKGTQVPLSQELDFIRQYFYMQQEKGGYAKHMSFTVTGNPQQLHIPPLLLINLIENCFTHSDLGVNPHGYIRIQLKLEGYKLALTTCNTYIPKKSSEAGITGGLGLKNTSRRLALYYPNQHHLHLSQQDGCYKAELTVLLQNSHFHQTPVK